MSHLLIVDDTVESCDILAKLLARCGHAPTRLYGGAEVLPALRDGAFDLVVLDVMMPHVDGFAVLAAVRAAPEPAVARTPVVMYTAVADPRQRARALALGADAWVVKGVPFAHLRDTLERVIADGGRASAQE